MTQFGPPPYEPPISNVEYGYAPTLERKPWSTAAISAFVLSILGCLGITALLGLVLGVVGIVRTSGGKRRGMGLAIAAIPISLITGVLSLCVLAGFISYQKMTSITIKLSEALKAGSSDFGQAASELHSQGSEDFRAAVSEKQLEDWFSAVREKHGTLVEITGAEGDQAGTPDIKPSGGFPIPFVIKGKFVNGPASVRVVLLWQGWNVMTIDDLEVDGLSPRQSKNDVAKPD